MPRIVKRTHTEPHRLVVGGRGKMALPMWLTKNQPLCDGSHKLAQGEEAGKLYWYDQAGQRHECAGSGARWCMNKVLRCIPRESPHWRDPVLSSREGLRPHSRAWNARPQMGLECHANGRKAMSYGYKASVSSRPITGTNRARTRAMRRTWRPASF